MNLHPIIVHFPVVLLTVYCILEIITSFAYKDHPNLLWLKKRSLWIGVVTMMFAFASGDSAEHIVGKSDMVRIHEQRADMSRNIFVIISIIYIYGEEQVMSRLPANISSIMRQIYVYSIRYKVTVILAILGFLILGGVGALGGAIIRGTDHEPIAKWIVETFPPRPLFRGGD